MSKMQKTPKLVVPSTLPTSFKALAAVAPSERVQAFRADLRKDVEDCLRMCLAETAPIPDSSAGAGGTPQELARYEHRVRSCSVWVADAATTRDTEVILGYIRCPKADTWAVVTKNLFSDMMDLVIQNRERDTRLRSPVTCHEMIRSTFVRLRGERPDLDMTTEDNREHLLADLRVILHQIMEDHFKVFPVGKEVKETPKVLPPAAPQWLISGPPGPQGQSDSLKLEHLEYLEMTPELQPLDLSQLSMPSASHPPAGTAGESDAAGAGQSHVHESDRVLALQLQRRQSDGGRGLLQIPPPGRMQQSSSEKVMSRQLAQLGHATISALCQSWQEQGLNSEAGQAGTRPSQPGVGVHHQLALMAPGTEGHLDPGAAPVERGEAEGRQQGAGLGVSATPAGADGSNAVQGAPSKESDAVTNQEGAPGRGSMGSGHGEQMQETSGSAEQARPSARGLQLGQVGGRQAGNGNGNGNGDGQNGGSCPSPDAQASEHTDEGGDPMQDSPALNAAERELAFQREMQQLAVRRARAQSDLEIIDLDAEEKLVRINYQRKQAELDLAAAVVRIEQRRRKVLKGRELDSISDQITHVGVKRRRDGLY